MVRVGEELKFNLWKAAEPSRKGLILIGGSGDDRNVFNPVARILISKVHNINIISFSFHGTESGKNFPPQQQIADLKELLDTIKEEGIDEYFLACTSMGSISSVFTLTDPKYSVLIKSALFLDPADYYLKPDAVSEPATWPGYEPYNPTAATVSSHLKELSSDTIIHVVSFALRNYGPGGYSPDRSADNPKYFPRLNPDMVKAFYDHTPIKNRGQFLSVPGIPHAFLRDGNLNKNYSTVADLIVKILKLS